MSEAKRRPRKAVKYPKKLRQKLEKIADARDDRSNRQEFSRSKTLWHSFLAKKSVHSMHARADHVLGRISNYNRLFPTVVDYIYPKPPWTKAEPDA